MVGFFWGEGEGANDAKAGRAGRLSPQSWISRNLAKIEGRFAPARIIVCAATSFMGTTGRKPTLSQRLPAS
jgi:hypothetical protein